MVFGGPVNWRGEGPCHQRPRRAIDATPRRAGVDARVKSPGDPPSKTPSAPPVRSPRPVSPRVDTSSIRSRASQSEAHCVDWPAPIPQGGRNRRDGWSRGANARACQRQGRERPFWAAPASVPGSTVAIRCRRRNHQARQRRAGAGRDRNHRAFATFVREPGRRQLAELHAHQEPVDRGGRLPTGDSTPNIRYATKIY